MFLAENRLIFFWKHIRSVCCFSMTALFADNVNFSLFFVCRTILCGEFIACFTYFNCNVDITGLGRNGSFFKIFCDHTAASWIVITNLFNSKFSRLFADFCFYNVSWFLKSVVCSCFVFMISFMTFAQRRLWNSRSLSGNSACVSYVAQMAAV